MSVKRDLSRKPGRKRISPNALSPVAKQQVAKLVADAMGINTLPDGYPAEFAEIYLREVFWSKYSSAGASKMTGKKDSTLDERRQRAIEKWLKVEERNESTNGRLKLFQVKFGSFTSEEVLDLASKFIQQTIGKAPPGVLVGEFTGGASTRVSRGACAIALKFEGKAHVSETAAPIFARTLFEFPAWGKAVLEHGMYEIRNASVLFTVPKNSEIDRVACKEPEINMYLQRACGLFIRKRLKRHGIDLQDQSRNRSLAEEGSKNRILATIDLSSASDTVTTELVRRLLPKDWFETLDSLRVKHVELPDGSLHTLQMFSSMGNGFTFELESLIFWSLVRAVSALIRCRGKIGVYGDDIICHRDVAKTLSRVFPFMGFTMNLKKTFFKGPFRESCGGHYWNGIDVTPVYFRESITTVSQVIQLYNQLLRWCSLSMMGSFPSKKLASLIIGLLDFVPAKVHGGQSYDRIDAAVTGFTPRQRLVQVNNPVREVPLAGSYLWWHHNKVKNEDVHSPTEAAEVGRWVLRPNRSWYESSVVLKVRHELMPQITLRATETLSERLRLYGIEP